VEGLVRGNDEGGGVGEGQRRGWRGLVKVVGIR
jgi:hypothetical protein